MSVDHFEDCNRSTAHGAIVLMYHRVIDLPSDTQLLAVSPANFDDHLDVLHRIANVTPLRELANAIRNDTVPPRAVAITFDDGYADNLIHAAPLLHKHAMSATVFVTARGRDVDREFWWDDLERLLLHEHPLPEALSIDIDGRRHEWSLPEINESPRYFATWNVLATRPPLPREALYLFLAKLLKPLGEVYRRPVMDALAHWSGQSTTGRPSHRTMTDDEIRRLSADGLIEIGAHTVTHPVLSTLPLEEQRAEILESRLRLERITGRDVESFSYPFGCRPDVSDATVRIVREAGFQCACANTGLPPGARCLTTTSSDPLRLPRAIVRNISGDELEQSLLSAWQITGLMNPGGEKRRRLRRRGSLVGSQPLADH